MKSDIASIPEAIDAIAEGRMVIMVDDEQRENEGDFVVAAEHITPEKVNFLAKEARGLICVTAPQERMIELDLAPMVPDPENTSLHTTNFTVSVDAKHGVETGISALDRYKTIKIFADRQAVPSDLARPGHIFPIGAKRGGVLVRAGHTEGSVDLMRLAGLQPSGVICEIQNEDGSMARLPELIEIAKRFECPLVTIKDLISYRMDNERLIKKVVSVDIPNEHGDWKLHMYEDIVDGEAHLAMVMGDVGPDATLVRVHSQCFTGDTLGSLRCECGPQLDAAMAAISKEGKGVIVYMHQEGRGIGLKNKLLAYALQEKGRDTVEANEELGFKADLREYGIGAQILADLGLKDLKLMTNNPRKIVGLKAFGLEVVERVSLTVGEHDHNRRYLETKKRRLGHLLGELENDSKEAGSKADIKSIGTGE